MESTFTRVAIIATTLTLFSFAATAQPSGATTTVGPANQSQSTSGPGEAAIAAGNVSQVDISDSQNTDKWAGFYGAISASKVLGSSSGTFFEWTAQSFDNAWVFATPSSAAAPTSLSAVSDPNTLLDTWDPDGGFDTGVANATRTFNYSKNPSSPAPVGAPNTATQAVETFGPSGPKSVFTTLLYENGDTTDSPVYVANGTSSTSGFTGSNFNYQMLVGVGQNSAAETFNFYLQLP